MNFEMDKPTFLFLNFSDPTKIYNSKEFIVSMNIEHYTISILSILFSLANSSERQIDSKVQNIYKDLREQ